MAIRKRVWTTSEGTQKSAWQVSYCNRDGKRRSSQFILKRDADAFDLRVRQELALGIHTADADSITVSDAVDQWIVKSQIHNLERSTVNSYQRIARLHVIPFLGSYRLTQLNGPMLQSYLDKLLVSRSTAMTAKAVSTLSMIVAEAQRRGQIAQNIVLGVKVGRSKRQKKQVEIPTADELKRMLAAASETERPFIITMITTGLRISEMRGITWADINLVAGRLTVKQRADEWGDIGAPKSDLGKRTIPIAPELISELKAWKLRCPPSEIDLVFPNSKGAAQLNGNLLKRMFKPLQIRAAVTKPVLIRGGPVMNNDGQAMVVGKYGFHALRHAAASNWIAAKIDLKRLQTWIGHSSIQITLDTYGHLICDDEKDAELAMSSSRGLFA